MGDRAARPQLAFRDLIAGTTPSPLAVTDSIPSVMIPRWHRGTEWVRDAAQRFHEEVESRVQAGAAVCENERVRLMWTGRGLWYDMDFYRRFEERLGAVFVWSTYLAIAADGYPRYGDDPLRTLAARFAAFTDLLYTPPWSCEWYVKEAKLHGVDGVVHLVSDDARGSYVTNRALRAAGIPVYELHADNVDTRSCQESTEQALGTGWNERWWADGPPHGGRSPGHRGTVRLSAVFRVLVVKSAPSPTIEAGPLWAGDAHREGQSVGSDGSTRVRRRFARRPDNPGCVSYARTRRSCPNVRVHDEGE